jgi:hypothetical protein
MNIPAVPKPDVPAFIDKVVVQIQDGLKAKLPWLNYSFGRAQKLVTTKEGKNYFYPAVHIGKGTYINVLPDQELGNYSFFTIDDPQEIDFNAHAFNNIKSKFALVFWFNLNKIFPGVQDRNTEAIKAQIIELLTRGIHLTEGRINIRQIFEQPENIYKGYSLKEVDSQYMMQPFAGLRFEGEMLFMEGGC